MMDNVLLARVDDRLIHGQVMTAWMKRLPAKQIIVVDDRTAKDDFMSSVLQMAAPQGVKVHVFTCEKAIKLLKKGISKPSILLAKTPITYKTLIDGGVDITAVNIGGMGINQERTTLHKNIAASPAERDAMKAMMAAGVDIKIQVIPQDSIVEIKGLL